MIRQDVGLRSMMCRNICRHDSAVGVGRVLPMIGKNAAVLALAWLININAPAADKKSLSIDDIVSMKRLTGVQISADGSRIAYLVEQPNDEQHSKTPPESKIWVWSEREQDARLYTRNPGRNVSAKWSPDSRTLAFLSTRSDSPGAQIYTVSADGENEQRLTAHPTPVNSFSWSPDGTKIGYLASKPETSTERKLLDLGHDEIHVGPGPDQPSRQQELWVLDLATHRSHPVNIGDLHVLAFEWSPDSAKFLLTIANDRFSDDEQLRPRVVTVSAAGGRAKPYCTTRGKLTAPSWSPDGGSIAFLGTSEGATDPYPGALQICHGEGSAPRNLIAGSAFTVESYRWMPDGESLVVVIAEGAHRSIARFGIRDRKVERLTRSPMEVAFRSPYSVSRDGGKIASVLASGTKPPDVWLIESGQMRQVTHLNPELESRIYGASEEFRWRARDGIEITGVLIKPVGFREGMRNPLIVQVHGSQVADTTEFQASWMNWGQLLAANGYAVLLPNYRGSLTGGARFARGNQGDFGGKDLDDIFDGIEALVSRGIADPNRLGIGGVSYGGFLSALAVTRSPRFKAAVMGIGLSNWISMAGETGGPEAMVALSWLHSPYEHHQLLWDRSPLAHAKNVRTPTLIYAGERDPLVPIAQSREFFRALRHFGVPSEFIIYPREGHSVLEPNHLRDNLKRILGWFDQYVKPAS